MRLLTLTNTATDLSAQKVPFLSDYTVVLSNPSAGSLTVQEADTSGGSYTTLAVVPAGGYAQVNLNKQFVKVSTAATVYGLGN